MYVIMVHKKISCVYCRYLQAHSHAIGAKNKYRNPFSSGAGHKGFCFIVVNLETLLAEQRTRTSLKHVALNPNIKMYAFRARNTVLRSYVEVEIQV